MNEVRGRTTLDGLLIVGLLAALGCGGGSARTTDGGGAGGSRGTGGSEAKDAATDHHLTVDRPSSMDMRKTSDGHLSGDGACGALGQTCCPDLSCQGDPATNVCGYLLIPNDYTCIHCGGVNEPCCQSEYCNDSTLACSLLGSTVPTCKTCGIIGNPCCGGETGTCTDSGACCSDVPGTGVCVASGSSCYLPNTLGDGMCAAGTCECGHENEPCCGSGPVTCLEPQDQCTLGELPTCKACGLPNNPCCPNNTCADGGCCIYTQEGFSSTCVANGVTCLIDEPNGGTCSNGTCGDCGRLGQPCCVDLSNICTAPNTFCPTQATSANCQACGGKGQPCCGFDSIDTTGTFCNSGLTCSSASATTAGTCN